MGKSDQVYLIHVLRSINQILDYTHGISEEMYPHIEWKKMAGMRDKLIHDYIDVDFTVIWATVQEILPDLKIDIQKILEM